VLDKNNPTALNNQKRNMFGKDPQLKITQESRLETLKNNKSTQSKQPHILPLWWNTIRSDKTQRLYSLR